MPVSKNILILAGAFSLASVLPSCKPDSLKVNGGRAYFDIKGFFSADSAKLAHKNPEVTKTVTHNGAEETKKVHISNWGNELRLFFQSDINKPAWQSSYQIINSGNLTLYKAKYPELITREIVVKKTGNRVDYIMIYNYTKNMLYESREQLSYFPDSLYLISRKQSVRVIGTNTYKIKGLLN